MKEIQKLAHSKGLTLVCNYRYELRDDCGVLFWAYYLDDIKNYLNNLVHA